MRWTPCIKRIGLVISLLSIALMLSQCRYHLRGSGHDDETYSQTPIALETSQPNSPFIKTLKQSLRTVDTQLVPLDQANVVLVIHDHVMWQNTRAISSNTQIRKHHLTTKVNYQITNAEGDPLTPARELSVTRSFTTDDNQMLGAQQEKFQVERAIHQELSYQLLNQLRTTITENLASNAHAHHA